MTCPFCSLPDARVILSSTLGLVIRDGFPISPGHSLVIPRRHIGSFFDLTNEERTDLLDLLCEAKRAVDREYDASGYNIGVNDGRSAGQTISHLHIHLIPRYDGDQDDPRGGVRWIFPGKADYWSPRDPDVG